MKSMMLFYFLAIKNTEWRFKWYKNMFVYRRLLERAKTQSVDIVSTKIHTTNMHP